MAYTRDQGRDFWFDFDNQTRFSSTFDDAYARAYHVHGLTFDSVMNALRVSFARADHPVHFQSVVQPGADGFRELAALQLAIRQVAFALRQAESGTAIEEVCRRLGVSQQTFYRWKKKFAGMGVKIVHVINPCTTSLHEHLKNCRAILVGGLIVHCSNSSSFWPNSSILHTPVHRTYIIWPR